MKKTICSKRRKLTENTTNFVRRKQFVEKKQEQKTCRPSQKKIDDESQLSNYKQTNHEYKTRWYMQIVAAAKLTNHRNNKSQPTNNNKIIRKIFATIASRYFVCIRRF